MKQAHVRSEKTVEKLLKSPELYEPDFDNESPMDEPVDEFEVAMTTKDRAEAERIMNVLKNAGDKRWREIRVRMRSM